MIDLRELDPGKVAAAASRGFAALEPEQLDVVRAAVAESGGLRLEIESLHSGDCLISLGGIAVAAPPAWTLLPTPEMPAADA